jgi:hypothetical protein
VPTPIAVAAVPRPRHQASGRNIGVDPTREFGWVLQYNFWKRIRLKTCQIALGSNLVFAVGTLIAGRPPRRSERAQFGHSAPTSGV